MRSKMSLPRYDVRGKVLAETNATIEMLAIARGVSKEKVVSDMLNTACLGVGYEQRLAAERYQRLAKAGMFEEFLGNEIKKA